MTEAKRPADFLGYRQPPLTDRQLQAASGPLFRYRIMAFATGIVLAVATIALVLKWVGVKHMEPGTGYLWLFHGYLYLLYVVITAILGFRLRWPLTRFAVVLLAGTIPTMSFVAEHYVTRSARQSVGKS